MRFVPNFVTSTRPKQLRERLRRVIGGFHRLRKLEDEDRQVVLRDAAEKLGVPSWVLK